MVLWIPGSADKTQVLAGETFSAGPNYNVRGTMPLKTNWNGDGTSANHHLAKDIASVPGTLWLRPVNPAEPPTAFQGDVWIQKNEPNLNPAYWRSDVTMFGLQGTIPVRGAGGTVTPGPTAQTKSAGYWSSDITIAGVTVPAGKVLVGTTIAGTAGTMPNKSAESIHMPASAVTAWSGDRVFLQPPLGYYDGTTWVTGASPGLVPSNIRNGVNILGLTGTLVEGKRTATGTFVDNGLPRTVNGLGFTPSSVELAFSDGSGNHTRVGYSFGQWYACITNSNQTQPLSTNFHQSSIFAGGFTCEVPFAVGYTITWRATE